MADLSDVETTLEGLMSGWVYPNGTSQPSAASAVPVKIVRGWPDSTDLTEHLKNNIAYISIYSLPGSERLTTRYPRDWQKSAAATTTLTMTVSGRTVTVGGSVSTSQTVAVLAGFKAYPYAIQSSDTTSTIAAALATLISGDMSASSAGPVLTVSSGLGLSARVAGSGQVMRELRRQERMFQITVWTATPEQRDVVSSFIDGKFAGVGDPNGLEFISLADGTQARLKYVRTAPTDKDELSGSFRRDLIYSIEYATTETMMAPEIIAFETKVETPQSSVLFDTFS